MPKRPPLTPVFVDARELRRKFAESGYQARMEAGTLALRIMRDGHPSAPKAPVPFCTRSQYIALLDEHNNEVAHVHQYLQPNGTLGASGKPDPKRVRIGQTLYILDVSDKI